MHIASYLACSWLLLTIADAYLSSQPRASPSSSTRLQDANNNDFEKRKAEIQRKILDLKKSGKLKQQQQSEDEFTVDIENLTGLDRIKAQREQLQRKGSVVDEYSDQLQEKLGRKARYLGMDVGNKAQQPKRQGQLGSLDPEEDGDQDTESVAMDDDLFDYDDDDDDAEDDDSLDEKRLVDLVAEKLRAKREVEREEEEERRQAKLEQLRIERESEHASTNTTKLAPATTGIGGAYVKNETAMEEKRRPSRGSWGQFERPKDISKAFGGGRRIGAGYMKEGDREASYEASRQRMREYRVKMGIDVQSEADNAKEIDEAIKIAKLAMERGVYSTAVSALEKVTKWCSSNSKVGSTVFLELAMAYEAVGRIDEASQVYNKLTTCQVDEIKNNAKRLLYGLQSYEFMKSEAQLSSFNRKKIRNNFIETTGMDNFAANFDDVYNTAYVDTSSRKYKQLTENVVRSVREARQILLKATDVGIVERTKIIQALRSVARRFDDALQDEKKADYEARQPVAMIDGEAIVSKTKDDIGVVDFKLASSDQMIENLNGEWRLQLIADKTGDGVRYYNSTLSWQQVDTEDMQFTSLGPVGFLTLSEKGGLDFENEKRILRRSGVESSGSGGMLAGLLGPKGGATSSIVPQQIMTVDSILLVTRCAEVPRWQDEDKDHFAVWRKVEPGTYDAV